jgi:hypothetical protein
MVDRGGLPAGDVRLREWPAGSLCLREVDRIPIRLGWVPARPSCRWQSRRCRSRPARRRARAGRRLNARHRLRHRRAARRRTPQPRLPRPARRAHRPCIRPIIPVVVVVVLAQAWRGGPQHQISRVLKGCDELPDDQRTGRAAGLACAASRAADAVDTIVITTAVRHQARVVTGDPGDLTRTADCIGARIRIFATDRHPEPLNRSPNVDDGVRSRPSGDTGHRQCGSGLCILTCDLTGSARMP